MTTSFTFVPRVVSKYTKEWQGISRPPPPPFSSSLPDATTDDDEHDDHDDKRKGKEKAVEPAHQKQSRDIASLIALALSDYNIWLDPDLRWKLDACLRDDVSPDDAGFVPINYLLRRPPCRGALPHPDPSETETVKALRAHASRTLEVRMRLPSSGSGSSFSAAAAPASSVWYGTGKTSRKKDVGGYEVRRRDWATLRNRPSRGWSRARWDDLTAYIECIPPQYRSVGGIARFSESLLSLTDADAEAQLGAEPTLRVQCVTLPPHYLDKPGDTPRCRGYALVAFSTKADLEAVLRAWPWRRRIHVSPPTHDDNAKGDGDSSPIVKEAHKYGLRAISKARWDALNEEYLAYKQSLVEEVARAPHAVSNHDHDHEDKPSPHPEMQPQMETQTETQVQTTLSSPYPFDCLVFVRNVHPDTNKTMLKSLFACAFQDSDQDQSQDQDGTRAGQYMPTTGLDYVDFTRGMDTCHLRLALPSHTTRLLAYFSAHPTTQTHGLDTTGRPPCAGDSDKPISMERVQGKKEEVYWEKIPEQVRRQAVERVVEAQHMGGEALFVSGRNGASRGRRKKRTREY